MLAGGVWMYYHQWSYHRATPGAYAELKSGREIEAVEDVNMEDADANDDHEYDEGKQLPDTKRMMRILPREYTFITSDLIFEVVFNTISLDDGNVLSKGQVAWNKSHLL
jgi:hypothetical protein